MYKTFHVKRFIHVPHGTNFQIMTKNKKNTKEIGSLGEKVAVEYLLRNGFSILITNYWKKWGEIDIIAKKINRVHFVEVKSVAYETKGKLEYAVSHETWRPEEQVHQFKIHQIEKALETWISENNYEGEWQIDVLAIRLVPHETFATVKYIENIGY